MQVSTINYNLPKYNPYFKGNDDFEPINVETKKWQTGQYSKAVEPKNAVDDRTSIYSISPKSKLKNHAVRNALLFTLAGAALGGIGADAAIRHEAKQEPIAVVAHISGAPRELVEEWKISGMTIYPEVQNGPVLNNYENYSIEQISSIQSTQNNLADVYYNSVTNTVYAVLKSSATVGDIKNAFGIQKNGDCSFEILNNLYRPTMGGDLNTAKFKKGEIVRFSRADAGNFS